MAAFEEPIGTERLLLRTFRDTDADDVNVFQSDPEVVRYLHWEPRTPEQSREWVRERMAADRLAEDDDGVALAVERREDARVIGSVNVWLRSVKNRQGEVGFAFASDVQRQGYAREAMTALLDVFFPMLDLHRVYGDAHGDNAASAGLMRRLGMREEAHLRQTEMFKGAWADTLIYAILRDEWEAR